MNRLPQLGTKSSRRSGPRILGVVATAALALLGACESPPERPDVERVTFATPEIDTKVELRAGTVLHLLPTRTVNEGLIDGTVVDGLLREALRQSPHFDIAAGVESAESHDATLEVVLDSRAGRIECALVNGERRLPIEGVGCDPRNLTVAIDRLAWSLRLALGEQVEVTPRPVAVLYSASADCVRHCERAIEDQARGWRSMAADQAEKAVRQDPGCTVAILLSVQSQLAREQFEEAADRARRTLKLLERRCSLTTQHRLARADLSATAELEDSVTTRQIDDNLVELGEAYLEERPYDPDGLFTRATGLLARGDFAAAVVDLRKLRHRWPQNPFVGYQLAFAELGIDQPGRALDAIESVERALPDGASLLPKAMALQRTGALDELDRLLDRELRRTDETSEQRLTLLQFRAATAILRGDEPAAVGYCLAIVRWLRERPSISYLRSEVLRDAGETLIELGAAQRLAPELAAIRSQNPRDELALCVELLEALSNADDDAIVRISAMRFEQSDRDGYAAAVRATAAHLRSDLTAEGQEWTLALALDDRALTRARLIRALRQMGQDQQAQTLMEDTRDRLLNFDLRRPFRTPITSPGRALAWLAVR